MSLKRIELSSVASITSTASLFSPVSVVKELIENSIDADATSIIITIDQNTAGLQYLSIADDGLGIQQEDRVLLCCNHTTSKISKDSDIYGVKTLGFRGEALFFINQLTVPKGKMEIHSKTCMDKLGQSWEVGVNGEVITSSMKSIALPTQGTKIIIKNIFLKTPVRFKILTKQKQSNLEKLKNLILTYALINRHIRFQLHFVNYNNGRIHSSTNDLIINANTPQISILAKHLQLKSSPGKCFITNENIPLLESQDQWCIKSVILPNMSGLNELSKISKKQPVRVISVNNRPLSIAIGVGRQINKMIQKIYDELKFLSPSCYILNLENKGDGSVDPNIEPEKNDLLIKDTERFLDVLENVLMSLIVEGCGLVRKEMEEDLGDEEVGDMIHSNKDTSKETTKDTVVDIDEGLDWSRNMHDRLSSRSTTTGSQKTNNQMEEDEEDDVNEEDEDFTISKNINISNPFTLTNLQRQNKPQKTHLITPDNSVDSIDSSFSSSTRTPRTSVNTQNKTKISKILKPYNPPTKPRTQSTFPLKKPKKHISRNTQRYQLSPLEYLQSFQLKIPTPDFKPYIEETDIGHRNGSLEISSSILDFYESLDNMQLTRNEDDDMYYICSV